METVDDRHAAAADPALRLDWRRMVDAVEQAPQAFPIHYAILVKHQDLVEVRDAWCTQTGKGSSAFYKRRQREIQQLRSDRGLDPAGVDA